MKTRWILPILTVCFAVPTIGRTQTYQTERGALLGGVGGALAGAAIGKNNGDTGAGALIGGAVGLATGALIGNSMEQKAQARAYEQQQIYRMSRAVSTTDVITMTRNGLSDDVVANHIRENGVQRKLEVSDVIMLHKNGVSEVVITAMQNASVGTPVYVAPPQYAPRPVIVQEHYYVRPSYWHCPPYYGHHHHFHHHHHPHSHFHWGVTFGH